MLLIMDVICASGAQFKTGTILLSGLFVRHFGTEVVSIAVTWEWAGSGDIMLHCDREGGKGQADFCGTLCGRHRLR